jgi:hypothetical protein
VSAEEQAKEVRSQRHDFIKEYYKMATMDLDRHLKGGWQAIVVLAGGAAILAAGHDGKIGLPIATSIALASAFWGLLSVIDANYWSLRAIAFLSNVEAVYFSAEDRKVFNPYIGYHPSYKLLNSLRFMFWLCGLFGLASLLSLLWEINRSYPSIGLMWRHASALGAVSFLLWSLPGLFTLWGLVWVYAEWRKCLGQHIGFTKGSPGPGVRLVTQDMRHVTFEPVSGATPVATEANTHAKSLADMEARKRRLDRLAWIPWAAAILCTVIVLVDGVTQHRL